MGYGACRGGGGKGKPSMMERQDYGTYNANCMAPSFFS